MIARAPKSDGSNEWSVIGVDMILSDNLRAARKKRGGREKVEGGR